MKAKEYIEIGKLNIELFEKIGQHLITDEVVFTYERMNHVETKTFNKIKRNKKHNLLYKN